MHNKTQDDIYKYYGLRARFSQGFLYSTPNNLRRWDDHKDVQSQYRFLSKSLYPKFAHVNRSTPRLFYTGVVSRDCQLIAHFRFNVFRKLLFDPSLQTLHQSSKLYLLCETFVHNDTFLR